MQNNAEKLIALFGSQAELAAMIGAARAEVNRWPKPLEQYRGRGGIVPMRFNKKIIDVSKALLDVKARDLDWYNAVLDCLSLTICPECGGTIDDGRMV